TLTLTREGHLFLREAIDLYQRMKGLKNAFSLAGHHILSFSATELVILHRLVEPLRKFHKKNPHIRMEMLAQSPTDIEKSVREGIVDFGLATHAPDDSNLTYQVWKRSNLVAVTPRGHALSGLDRVTLHQLAEYPLILLTHDLSRRDDRAAIDMAFRRKQIPHHDKIILETSNSEIITCYVEAGLGVGIVSDTSMVDTRRRIEKVAIEADLPASEVGVLLRKEKIITPAMKEFFTFMGGDLTDWAASCSPD
ncbi:MAG: LysR family transcriptional regulator substrate-binding protein, partial [Candidatus Sumerlaeia bacterium]|nr:LysR family transcriptional regulator substrate-binding protein [Candidatus Sumerlaeia bacterium]